MSISNTTRTILSCILGVFLLGTFFLAPLTAEVAYAQSNVTALEEANEGDGVGVWIGMQIMTLGSMITGLGGSLLDNALDFFVIQLASTLGNPNGSGIGYVIESSWKVVRDVSNIVFIFGFIYIGIVTILNPTSSKTKGLIAQLIIAAVLINFSLFFVRAIIDVTNFFAYQILTLFGGNASNVDIAYAFNNAMGLTTLYETGGDAIAGVTSGGAFVFFIVGTIFLVVAGFIFAAAAITLTVRFVALILFMIFSPLLFVGAIFTGMEKYWKMLFNYAIYAPVFLFLMYLSIRILDAGSSWKQAGVDMASLLATGAEKTDGFAIILQFVVAVIFLILSLKSADFLGVTAGEGLVSGGKRLAGKATSGLAAAGLRNTAGRYANSKIESLQEKAPTSWVARRQLSLAQAAADSSFDARNIRVGKKKLGERLGVGEGRKGGFKTVQKEITDKEQKYAEGFGEVSEKDEKVQGWQTKIDNADVEMELLTQQRKAASTPEEKAEYTYKIKALKYQKDNYLQAKDYEKKRRQVGDAAGNALMATMSDGDRDRIANAYRDLTVADSPERKKTARENLAKLKAEIKKKMEEDTDRGGTRGYAGTLEDANWTSWFKGRLGDKDRTAGKEIRKKVEKSLKKSADDKQTDRIVEALKEKS